MRIFSLFIILQEIMKSGPEDVCRIFLSIDALLVTIEIFRLFSMKMLARTKERDLNYFSNIKTFILFSIRNFKQ